VGCSLYLNRGERVNTILGDSNQRFLPFRGSTRNAKPSINCLNCSLRRPQSIGRDKPLRAADAGIQGVTRCPQRADKTNNGCGLADRYGLGGGVGRGLAVGPDLGVGVGLGVGVVVAVDVAVAVGVAVAVAVGVGVGVGPHAEAVAVAVGVGLGVAVGDGVPTAAAISIRPQPYTLFGGPAVPHCVEEINTAELFKASRLVVI
jgi:hypothetical protein